MRTLDRYVLRELVVPFWIGISVGVLLLVGTMLINYAQYVIQRAVPLILVLKLLLLKIPDFSVIAMPMAMAFAASLAINRLARQGELTPIRMAGARFSRILLPVALAGLIGGVFSYVMAEKAAPWANKRANRLVDQIMLQSLQVNSQTNAYVRAGEYAVSIGRLSRTGEGNFHLENVLAYQVAGKSPRAWLVAREVFVNRRVWTFSQVVRRDVDRDGLTRRETRSTQWTMILPEEVDFVAGTQQPNEMTGRELRAQIRMLRKTGAGDIARTWEMDYLNRFALPFACVIFALLASPISFRFARGGTFVGVLVSVICGFLYWNIMILSKILGSSGILPTLVAAWIQNVAFGLAAAYLVRRVG